MKLRYGLAFLRLSVMWIKEGNASTCLRENQTALKGPIGLCQWHAIVIQSRKKLILSSSMGISSHVSLRDQIRQKITGRWRRSDQQ